MSETTTDTSDLDIETGDLDLSEVPVEEADEQHESDEHADEEIKLKGEGDWRDDDTDQSSEETLTEEEYLALDQDE